MANLILRQGLRIEKIENKKNGHKIVLKKKAKKIADVFLHRPFDLLRLYVLLLCFWYFNSSLNLKKKKIIKISNGESTTKKKLLKFSFLSFI